MVSEHVKTAHEQVRDELRRADTKATTLLSLIGAVLAGVVALSTRTMPLSALIILGIAAVPIATAVVTLLTAVRARLESAAPGSWLWAAEHGADALTNLNSANIDATAVHVTAMARIARAKYRRINRAITLLTIGLAVLAVALILGLVLV